MLSKKILIPTLSAFVLVGCSHAGSTKPTPTATQTSTATQTASSATTPTSVTTTSAPVSGTTVFIIDNFDFAGDVTVKKGTVLEVKNQDSLAHTVTADDGSFDTGLIQAGKSKNLTLDKVGTFKINCSIHPSMTAVITVTD